MDNITHSLAGWALGQSGLKTKSRKGLAALILGANAPDIDVFFQWAPWEPLATHRGFTHSLVGGVLLLPIALWGLLLAIDRVQVALGHSFKSHLELRSKWLLALCYVGAISHPLFDLQTTYSVQLFSPLSGRWFHSDSLFIIDAWIWLILILGIAASQGREAAGRRDWSAPAQATLAIAFIYICFNLGLSETADRRVRALFPQASAIFASPPPLAFWRRELAWREGSLIRRARWSFRGGIERLDPPVADGMNDATVRRAIRSDPRLLRFLNWSILPVARVTRSGCKGTVVIADARYGLPGESRGPLSRESSVNLCA